MYLDINKIDININVAVIINQYELSLRTNSKDRIGNSIINIY